MDRETKRLIEEYRRNEAGPLENNVIDELIGGARSRGVPPTRDDVRARRRHDRRAPALHGRARSRVRRTAQRYRPGGTIRVGIPVFGASLEPYLLNEGPSLAFSASRASTTFTTLKGTVAPALATSWRPNAEATVWTFQIRRASSSTTARR